MLFANVKSFDIDLARGGLELKTIILPFVFPKLESIYIDYPNDLLNEHFYNFIEKHPTIRKIRIRNGCKFESFDHYRFSNVLVSRLETSLPSLTEIELQFYTITTDQVISFVNRFKSLKIFCFNHYAEFLSIEYLRNRLDSCWSLTTTQRPDFIKIERRV